MSTLFGVLFAVLLGLLFWFWASAVVGGSTESSGSAYPTAIVIEASPTAVSPPSYATATPAP